MNLVYIFAVQLLWTLFRRTFEAFQSIIWYINGTQKIIKNNYHDGKSQAPVQVLKIWARYKFCPMEQPSTADNFLMTHKEFVGPEYVLQDHITVYSLNKNEAVFIETEKDVDVTHSNFGAFVRHAQYNLAKNLIIMPMHAFHQLGEKVGLTEAKIIVLGNTTRCGSTLLTQVFEATGSAVAYSEPDTMNALATLTFSVSEEEKMRIIRNCINIMCKPRHFKDIKCYVFKLCSPTIAEMPVLMKVLSGASFLFMYRDGLKCSKSCGKICNEIPSLALMYALGKFSGKFTKASFALMGLPGENFDVKLGSLIHFGAIVWCSAMRLYLDVREKEIKISAIRYEDLVGDTTYAYKKVFEYCGLPYDANAVELAMGRDSQRGSSISQQKLKKYKDEEFTDDIKRQTDEVCKQYNLPCFPDPYIAPGTITYREHK